MLIYAVAAGAFNYSQRALIPNVSSHAAAAFMRPSLSILMFVLLAVAYMAFLYRRNSAVRHGDQILSERMFKTMLALECKRAERSGKPFALMVLNCQSAADENSSAERSTERLLTQAVPIILRATRQTDLVGWYGNQRTVGIVFTELRAGSEANVAQALRAKVTRALAEHLEPELAAKIALSLPAIPRRDLPDDLLSATPAAAPAQSAAVTPEALQATLAPAEAGTGRLAYPGRVLDQA